MHTITIDHPDIQRLQQHGIPASEAGDEFAALEVAKQRYAEALLEDRHWLASTIERMATSYGRFDKAETKAIALLQTLKGTPHQGLLGPIAAALSEARQVSRECLDAVADAKHA